MTIQKILSGTLVKTADLIAAFNQVIGLPIPITVDDEERVRHWESVLYAIDIYAKLVDLQQIERDPKVNSIVKDLLGRKISDAVAAYFHEYVV